MKHVIAALAGSLSIASAQFTYNPGSGEFTCPADDPNGAYCAGDSLNTNIIIRCNGGVGQPGNCNDNLAGYFPQGVNYAPCYETSPNAGDAACSKNCIVQAPSGNFPLPASVNCIPVSSSSSSALASTSAYSPSSTLSSTFVIPTNSPGSSGSASSSGLSGSSGSPNSTSSEALASESSGSGKSSASSKPASSAFATSSCSGDFSVSLKSVSASAISASPASSESSKASSALSSASGTASNSASNSSPSSASNPASISSLDPSPSFVSNHADLSPISASNSTSELVLNSATSSPSSLIGSGGSRSEGNGTFSKSATASVTKNNHINQLIINY